MIPIVVGNWFIYQFTCYAPLNWYKFVTNATEPADKSRHQVDQICSVIECWNYSSQLCERRIVRPAAKYCRSYVASFAAWCKLSVWKYCNWPCLGTNKGPMYMKPIWYAIVRSKSGRSCRLEFNVRSVFSLCVGLPSKENQALGMQNRADLVRTSSEQQRDAGPAAPPRIFTESQGFFISK